MFSVRRTLTPCLLLGEVLGDKVRFRLQGLEEQPRPRGAGAAGCRLRVKSKQGWEILFHVSSLDYICLYLSDYYQDMISSHFNRLSEVKTSRLQITLHLLYFKWAVSSCRGLSHPDLISNCLYYTVSRLWADFLQTADPFHGYGFLPALGQKTDRGKKAFK